jgi:16S rRNA (adenine1518-N6/adenine1519-N6)-dimethyltransferase
MRKRGAPLGQHFLKSPTIANAIAEAGDVKPGDTILEVGPGKGMLTEVLLARGARVTAIEKDPAMAGYLKGTFRQELANGRLTLIVDDIRTVAETRVSAIIALGEYKVVANIPYYITGELMRMFLTAEQQPSTIVFLVQKEVAERVARSKKESLLSLSVKAYGQPRYVRTVKAGSFSPPPSVDSAVLAIEHISRKNFKDVSEEMFFKLIHTGFAAKRKTLMGNLKRSNLYREEMRLDPRVRAEDLSLKKWLALTRLF